MATSARTAGRSRDKTCKDCGPSSRRAAPFPGPRCATHHRVVKAARKAAAQASQRAKLYGLGPGQYDELYAAQGGVCAICKRATGKTKALAVDHDHKTGYVRGLCCGICNKLLGHLRDDPELARNIVSYLEKPPAHDVIGLVKKDE